MKNILIFIFLVSIIFNSKAQIDEVTFTNYTPRWFQLIVDTNFVPGTFTPINAFNANFPFLGPHVEDEYSYIPFACYNGDYQNDGAILVKVRNQDGVILWEKYMNTYNGDDQNFYSSFFVDDKIYYAGKKRTKHSILLNEEWQLGGHLKQFYRIIDKNIGNIEEEVFNTSDTIGTKTNFIARALVPVNGTMKEMNRIEEGVTISNISENTLEPTKTQLLPYPTPLLQANTKHVRGLFIRENNQKSSVYYQAVSRDTSLEKHIGSLDYYEIEGDSFVLTKKVDFSKYVRPTPGDPLQNRVFYKFANDGGLVLTHSYQDTAFPYFKTWLLKIDAKGEVDYYIEDVKTKDTNHSYEFAVPFYIDKDQVLLLTLPSSTEERGSDIVHVTRDGEINVKGYLTTGNTTRVGIGGISMSPAGDIIFAIKWDELYSVILGMHISDFGINLSSEDTDFTPPKPLLTVSPNPATDHIILSVKDETYTKGVVSIRDIDGRTILSQTCQTGEQIDVHHLPSGTYIVLFNPESRPEYFLTTKLVKP
jgi:hypothetical protein